MSVRTLSSHTATARALLAAALVLSACGQGDPPPTAARPKPAIGTQVPPAKPSQPATAPPALNLPDGARVFVDLSYSMSGFPIGGPSALESVHRQVLEALMANRMASVDYCELGKDPAPKCGQVPDATKYRDRQRYKGMTSPLATVLETPAADPSVAQRPKAQVFEKRINVFITDGLESGSPLVGATQGGSAIPGPNVFRLRDAINERIKDGFGAWVLTISLPFNGRVIPERGLGQELFKRAQSHLQQVALDPAYAGIPMEAKDLVRPERDGTQHYQYIGPRPIVLIVLTQDIELGRSYVSALKTRLDNERVSQPANMVEAVEFAPHDVQSFVFNRLTTTISRGDRTHFMRIAERREESGMVGRYECRGPASGRVELAAFVARKSDVKLPAGLKQTLEARLTPQTTDSGAVTAPSPLGQGRFAVEIDCAKIANDATFEVELTSGVVASDGASGWWHRWSAPNPYEMPEKVYGLADFVQGVLSAQVRAPALQDVARLVVTKKG